ncbi:MAG: hypothetical protein J5802_03020 [Butyrivibrio sp.]|nr:hypothetical protein [Butyrivibrio sp.]
MIYVNFITSLITGIIAIYVLFLAFKNRLSLTLQEPYKKKNEFIILFTAIMLGLVVIRLYHFGIQPVWYYIDEAMSSYDAYSLMLYGTDHWGNSLPTHMYAWGYTHQSAFFTYSIVPFMKILGYSMYAIRLPLLILSVIGAAFLALTVRDILGDRMAIVALIVCAFNPWHFVQSRYGIDCNVFPHLFIVGTSFFVHFIKTEKKRFLYIGTLIMAITLYSYMVAVYSVQIFMLMLFLYFLCKKKIDINTFIFNVIVFIVAVLPMIILVMMNLMGVTENIKIGALTIPSLSGSHRMQDVLFLSENIFGQFCLNVSALFQNVFMQVDAWPWDTVEHYGTMFHCMASVMFVGIIILIVSLKKKQNTDYMWILLSYLVMSAWIGIITADVTEIRRLNIFYYLGMILICLTINSLAGKRKIYLGMIVMILPLGMLLLYSYHHSYLDDLGNSMSITGTLPNALAKAKEFDADKYYITDDVYGPDTAAVSEIITLVAHRVDPQYFNGTKDYEYDEKENSIPYRDKYIYTSADKFEINANENAVYVVNHEDAKLFDHALFEEYEYGIFSVIVPKSCLSAQ